MTDIFFSYKSGDRERVRPVRDAFVAQGFDVFWDQQVPVGADWDTWIRQHLELAKCVIVFWSLASVASDNVRHEATVAKQQSKLIPVLLEPLAAGQFPMGLYTQQAAILSGWQGDPRHEGWIKLCREVEAKITPVWVQHQIHEMEAELVAERARRTAAEGRDKALQARVAKEAQARQELQLERDQSIDEVATLQARLAEVELQNTHLSRQAGNAEAQANILKERFDALAKRTRAAEAAASEMQAKLEVAQKSNAAAQQQLMDKEARELGIGHGWGNSRGDSTDRVFAEIAIKQKRTNAIIGWITIIASIVFGLVSYTYTAISYPTTMLFLLRGAKGVQEELSSLGLADQYMVWVDILLQPNQIVLALFILLVRLCVPLLRLAFSEFLYMLDTAYSICIFLSKNVYSICLYLFGNAYLLCLYLFGKTYTNMVYYYKMFLSYYVATKRN